MDPTDVYYKTKRNLLIFVGLFFISTFFGFKIVENEPRLTIFPFQLGNPNAIPIILFAITSFNLFQFILQWVAQREEVRLNKFHQFDFFATFAVSALSIATYLFVQAVGVARLPTVWSLGGIVAAILIILLVAVSLPILPKLINRSIRSAQRIVADQQTKQESELARRLMSSSWILDYAPYDPEGRRTVRFGAKGSIGSQTQGPEKIWKIRNGLLELLDEEGRIQSRFSYDAGADEFRHTNDKDLSSTKNQRLSPTNVNRHEWDRKTQRFPRAAR